MIETGIRGLYCRKLNSFCDFRGQFIELWNHHDTDIRWVEEDISISKRDVLRGFHLEKVSTKLVTPFFGKIFIAFIDRKFNFETFYCTDNQRYQFLVSPNIGIAHLVLSEIGGLHYKRDYLYDINDQETISWKDNRIRICWPVKENDLILSMRDRLTREIC